MKRFVGIMLVISLWFSGATASAAPPRPLPPQSDVYGKPLAEWMKLYFTWLISQSPDDHVDGMRFMPLPDSECKGKWTAQQPARCTGHIDVQLAPNTPFALSIAGWGGERYQDGSEDLPLDPTVFTNSRVLVRVDGRPVINSAVHDLNEYYFDPVVFDNAIEYPEPSPSGAVAAIWIQGLGFVHPPLAAGTHTISMQSEVIIPEFNFGVKFATTWTITVGP
jgi:hypothetical protein